MIYPIIFPTFLLFALGRPVDPEVNITYSSSVVAVAVDSGGSGELLEVEVAVQVQQLVLSPTPGL